MQKFILKHPYRVIALLLGLGLAFIVADACRSTAQAAEPKDPGRKLTGTSWHCWGSYPCELWHLTRPARPGETPEKIVIAGEKIVDEAAPVPATKLRGELPLPSGWKLLGAGWKCYGGGGCEVTLQLRRTRPGETPETHLFDNGKEHYVIKETP